MVTFFVIRNTHLLFIVDVNLIKEGLGMPKAILIAAVAVLFMFGMLTTEFAVAADAPGAGPTDNIAGESR